MLQSSGYHALILLAQSWDEQGNEATCITRSFLPEILIVLEAVLLKFHAKLAPAWALAIHDGKISQGNTISA